MNETMQSVLKHLETNLSLSEKDVDVIPLPFASLPDYFSVVYVEERGSHGHVSYHYVFVNGKIFSSADRNGFDKILEEINFLKNQTLTATQIAILFRLLKVSMRDKELLTKEDLNQGSVLANYAMPAAIRDSDGRLEIEFYTYRGRADNRMS